ncbi:hypothetical protein [Streptobacillus moniliformis]|uniref:hypothetical protein n=1 Tax=Streptobacillus moniliformis TaxID=34105 RepID=UPI0007E2F7F4|nr:hypothetical protein [Streptobacillus moniliformis]
MSEDILWSKIHSLQNRISSMDSDGVSKNIFKDFRDKTKEQVYLLRDEDKRLQDEINGLKNLVEEVIKENKELKQEIEKLKVEKSDKDYYSLDI